MTDSFNKLRKAIFSELEKQRKNQEVSAPVKRFGPFVDTCLANLGRSRAEFAKQLGIEPEFADAILDGLLPESEIDDGLLVEIARVIQYEPNLLRIMLQRPVSSPASAEDN